MVHEIKEESAADHPNERTAISLANRYASEKVKDSVIDALIRGHEIHVSFETETKRKKDFYGLSFNARSVVKLQVTIPDPEIPDRGNK